MSHSARLFDNGNYECLVELQPITVPSFTAPPTYYLRIRTRWQGALDPYALASPFAIHLDREGLVRLRELIDKQLSS